MRYLAIASKICRLLKYFDTLTAQEIHDKIFTNTGKDISINRIKRCLRDLYNNKIVDSTPDYNYYLIGDKATRTKFFTKTP